MQNKAKNTNRKKVTLKPVYKPYLRGNIVSKTAAKRGARVFFFSLVFIFIYLLAGSALAFDNILLRILANGVLVAAAAMVMYSEGAHQGETDVGFAEIAQERLDEGRNVPASEHDLCFHPLKGIFSLAVGVLPLVIVCTMYALLTERQVFSLGVLPSWVSTYESQAEIAQGLAYYHEKQPFMLVDGLRIFVRLLNFPYVTMAGVDNYDAMYIVDKLAPLLCLIAPSFYAWGYLRGPRLRALVHGSIRMNRRKHNKREKRAREERRQQMQKKSDKKELV